MECWFILKGLRFRGLLFFKGQIKTISLLQNVGAIH
jgi:hypothetical protein